MVKRQCLSGDEAAETALRRLFQERGYVRVVNRQRREREGQKYKKGYEVRLATRSEEELAWVRQLLQQVGLKGGKPFQKQSRMILPVYGKGAVEWFLQGSGRKT